MFSLLLIRQSPKALHNTLIIDLNKGTNYKAGLKQPGYWSKDQVINRVGNWKLRVWVLDRGNILESWPYTRQIFQGVPLPPPSLPACECIGNEGENNSVTINGGFTKRCPSLRYRGVFRYLLFNQDDHNWALRQMSHDITSAGYDMFRRRLLTANLW